MIERVEVVPYGRPATEALSAVVQAAHATDALAPITVIVPSNLAGLTARRVLGSGTVGPGGIANVAFVTPFRLAELLAADRLFDRRPLTNPVLGAAVRRALAGDPGPFAAVADHHATEAALAALYAELSNVSAAPLERLASSGGATGGRAVRFQRAVRRHLAGFHDEADLARAAAERPDLAAAVAPLGEVVWYLPQPTTAPLVELLAAVLAASSGSVVVGVTGESPADEAVWSTLAAAGVARPPNPTAPASPPTASRIVSVTDADEEVRAVVRELARLAESGVPLHRIGVFHPTPEPYVALLEQQLAAAAIPANGPSRRRLAESVAGRTILAALDLPAERWRRDRVLALVGLGPLRLGERPVRPSAWETLSRAAGVLQDLDDWHRKLDHHRQLLEGQVADLPPDDPHAVSLERELVDLAELRAFVDGCATGVAEVEGARGWAAKSSAARSLLDLLLGPGHRHGSWPDREQDAFDRTEDALVRLATLDELEPDPSHAVFGRALRAELDVARGRNGRFGEGVVYGPLTSAVGHDLDAVFVLGCTEGLCPAARRDDAMLPDTVRALADDELELRSARLHEQHRSFLAALAAAPARARTLTFPRGDLRGGGRRLPSRWLLDSASALAGITVHATEFDEVAASVVEVVPSFASGVVGAPVHGSLAERDLAALAHHRAEGGAVRRHPVASLVERGLQAQAARRSPAFTEWDGNVGGQPIPSTAEHPLSPSRLEAWAACGYRYFLAHVLGLGERDDPERVVDLDARDKGSGVHLVLERFIGEAIDEGTVPEPDEPWSPEQRARMRAIADEVFLDLEARGRTGRLVHWKVQRAELAELLEEMLDADDEHRAASRSRPVRVEMPFGFAGAPPVELRLADGRTLAFRGWADRIDRTDDDRLLVSDYKTGKGGQYRGIDADDPVQGGGMLQLGLYAEAAEQLLGASESEAHYWIVHPAAGYERYGYPWTSERRQRMVDVLTTIADGIEGGIFPVVPGELDLWRGTHESCRFCAFDHVCARDRGEHAAAKAEAPELELLDVLDAWEPEP